MWVLTIFTFLISLAKSLHKCQISFFNFIIICSKKKKKHFFQAKHHDACSCCPCNPPDGCPEAQGNSIKFSVLSSFRSIFFQNNTLNNIKSLKRKEKKSKMKIVDCRIRLQLIRPDNEADSHVGKTALYSNNRIKYRMF